MRTRNKTKNLSVPESRTGVETIVSVWRDASMVAFRHLLLRILAKDIL